MVFADALLARRIESAEAAISRACAEGRPGAAVMECAGGLAVFQGADSPLTHAAGLGLHGPVPGRDLDTLESFFRCRGACVSIELCPLADPGLLESLAARGYRATEFNTVLIKELAGTETIPTPRIRAAVENERDLWSYAVGYGFFEQAELTEEEMDVGRAIFAVPGVRCYLNLSEAGQPAGGGALAIRHGLGMLFADSTIPAFRRRGLHRDLIAARLNESAAQACDLAAASTLPGSPSQRNYERMGFRVAYTKVTLVG
ncbi:MAG TPA: hypothetical protein VJ732_14670 [Bryobacteraceae bacterium]|nr:hypothetical protein [Bryobacteraceae bacterium]